MASQFTTRNFRWYRRFPWPRERVQEPIPQIVEENVDVARLVPQERVQWIDAQIVQVCCLQISEDSEQIETNELPKQWDMWPMKIDASRDRTSGIFGPGRRSRVRSVSF